MKNKKQVKREAKQLFQCCLEDGLLDQNRVRTAVRTLATGQHRDCRAVLAQFVRLVRLDVEQHTANIESATPLPVQLQTLIQMNLTHRYRSKIDTKFSSRRSLIGGVRIQVGWDVYDSSVSARLAVLEQRF